MFQSRAIERVLIEQFLESLRGLPGVRAEPDALDSAAEIADRGFDAKVDLSVAGGYADFA